MICSSFQWVRCCIGVFCCQWCMLFFPSNISCSYSYVAFWNTRIYSCIRSLHPCSRVLILLLTDRFWGLTRWRETDDEARYSGELRIIFDHVRLFNVRQNLEQAGVLASRLHKKTGRRGMVSDPGPIPCLVEHSAHPTTPRAQEEGVIHAVSEREPGGSAAKKLVVWDNSGRFSYREDRRQLHAFSICATCR